MRRGVAIAVFVALAFVAAACEPALETLVPVGQARIDCGGVPPQVCQQAVADARANGTAPLVELIARCTIPPCTVQQGEMQVRARYADGSESTYGSGWSGAMPAPVPPGVDPPEPVGPLPVEPVCIGVVQQLCEDMASSAISELPPGSPQVGSITVRCKAVCTPTKAEGETLVLFEDGTSTTSGWAYESVGG